MSYNNTPITAKIKRTSQGGMITQPILNMGAPVKMKASSPAKQTIGDDTKTKQQDFKNEMSKQDKARADRLAASKAAKEAKDKASYSSMMDKYRSNVSSLNADIKNASKSFGKNDYGMRAAGRKAKEIEATENKLYTYDKKNKPGSTDGYTAKQYTLAKASGTYKSKAKPVVKETVKETVKDTATKKSYVKKGGKATGSMKDYKVGSQARSDEYTARGWKQDATSTVAKPKAKARPKVKVVSAIVPVGVKNVAISTKLDTTKKAPKASDKQIKKANNKLDSAERKDNRASRVKQKGIDALASGDKKKALRLKKRAARITNRADKKRGQAARAIQPK